MDAVTVRFTTHWPYNPTSPVIARLGGSRDWSHCMSVIDGMIASLWMLCAILAGSERAWTIAVGYDQLGNATFGGDEDETISSRCWRYRADPGYYRLVRLIDWLAGNPNHCKDAFGSEQRKYQ